MRAGVACESVGDDVEHDPAGAAECAGVGLDDGGARQVEDGSFDPVLRPEGDVVVGGRGGAGVFGAHARDLPLGFEEVVEHGCVDVVEERVGEGGVLGQVFGAAPAGEPHELAFLELAEADDVLGDV